MIELTNYQHEVLHEIPYEDETFTEEHRTSSLAEKFNTNKSAFRSTVSRIRDKGVDIEYDYTAKCFYRPYDADEEVESPGRDPGTVPEKLPDDMRHEGVTMSYVMEEYDIRTRDAVRRLFQTMRERGYTVEFEEVDDQGTRLYYIPEEADEGFKVADGDGTYRFAICSDTHLGSKAEHLDELHDFYDRVAERDIDVVFHAGDISDGWEVHQGHLNVIKGEAAGWERLENYVVENFPQRDGVTTLFIEGNHDHKLHRRTGVRFGKLIANRRPDLKYCGDSMARFVFDAENDIDLELIHPSGGRPYTAGYRFQTLYRERPVDLRPTISVVGHLHGSIYVKTEGVLGLYAGGWKGTTTWGKRKGNQSEIGGWIVEMDIEDGEVRRFCPEWIEYESRDAARTYSEDDLTDMVGHHFGGV